MLLAGDDGTFKLGAELDVELPSVDDPRKAVALIQAPHRLCPYSKAIRGNVDVAFTVNGIAVETEAVAA